MSNTEQEVDVQAADPRVCQDCGTSLSPLLVDGVRRGDSCICGRLVWPRPGTMEAVVIAGMEAAVEALRRERNDLREAAEAGNETVRRLREEISALQHDREVVYAALGDEAERRDWCNEYHEWIDNVNPGLLGVKLQYRPDLYREAFHVEVAYRNRGSLSDEIRAALEEVLNDFLDNIKDTYIVNVSPLRG